MDFSVIGIPAKDGVHLVIQCPLCGEIHLHGAGRPGELAYGSRTPHCVGLGDAIVSYTIIPPPNDQIENLLRENLKKRAKKKGVNL